MQVGQAKTIARAWIEERDQEIPGFAGAFIHGSGAVLPDDAELPETSDLDLMVVIDGPMPARKPGKFQYQGLLLEVSYLASDEVASGDQVLGAYYLAGSFRQDGVLADPTGQLASLQHIVERDFAKHDWVVRRCTQARDRVLHGFPFDTGALLPDQVISWLFPTGVLTHILLVAGLENPTVRTRYLATRRLLERYDLVDRYPTLLTLLGADRLSSSDTATALDAIALQFDAAAQVVSPSYPFAADLSDDGRAVAIDGSRELIAQGDYREALFWMLATATRCQQVFHAQGDPALIAEFEPPYRQLLARVGIRSSADLVRRRADTNAFVPAVWATANEIIAANPGITE